MVLLFIRRSLDVVEVAARLLSIEVYIALHILLLQLIRLAVRIHTAWQEALRSLPHLTTVSLIISLASF